MQILSVVHLGREIKLKVREIKLKVCVNSELLVHHMLLSGKEDFSLTIRLLWECFTAALLPWTEALHEVIPLIQQQS